MTLTCGTVPRQTLPTAQSRKVGLAAFAMAMMVRVSKFGTLRKQVLFIAEQRII